MSIESRISFLPKKSDKESLEKNKESKKFRLTPNSDGLFAGGIATFRELDPIIGSDATLINAHYYPGSMNDLEHEIIIHPFATLFRNYICPEAQFSSFSEYGEAFVHGFQAVSFPNEVRFDGVNEYDQLNLEYFANFIKNNCRHIENLTKDQIVEIVRYYLTGYFAAKEYESQKHTQRVTKLKQDMDQLRQGVKSTLNTMLLDRDENTLEWANTFLDIPEIECIDINTILKKVNNTLLLNENAIETLFDSRKPTQSNSSN